MDDDLILDAKLTKGVYTGDKEVDGWTRDDTLSNQNRAVFSKNGKARVVFRGTDISNPDDWGTDILLGLGLQDRSSRFKNAKRTADLTADKYGKQNVSLAGHSLGGSQSAWVSRKTGLKGTGFNAGWSPIDALRKRTYSNFKNVRTTTDPVSWFSPKRTNTLNLRPKVKNSHSLVNFLP